MASFRVEWKRSALKELRGLPRDAVRRLVEVVAALGADPMPAGAKKLAGAEHTYRLRVGDYRVVYSVWSAVLIVEVVRVGHRREVYR
ncbi:MAG: type II toxin-antitoxin system RelE family toxin [Deferrisomatales bacterium]